MQTNPIRKWKPMKVSRPGHTLLVYRGTVMGAWVAHCPTCSVVLSGHATRKSAKDRLHLHMREHP
jgi:hypothetical protein